MEKFEDQVEPKFAHLAPDIWKKLGEIPRTGWVMRGVQNPETVQEHTILLRILAMQLRDFFPELSSEEKSELVDMLEVHDWGEAIVGDEVILSEDAEEKAHLLAEKHKKEHEAMQQICAGIGAEGQKIFDLWLRFEDEKDSVARLANELDRHQSVEKAFEYEQGQGIPLLFAEFRDYYKDAIKHPVLLRRLAELTR